MALLRGGSGRIDVSNNAWYRFFTKTCLKGQFKLAMVVHTCKSSTQASGRESPACYRLKIPVLQTSLTFSHYEWSPSLLSVGTNLLWREANYIKKPQELRGSLGRGEHWFRSFIQSSSIKRSYVHSNVNGLACTLLGRVIPKLK